MITSETPPGNVRELEDLVDEEQILSLLHPLLDRVDTKDGKGCQFRLVHHSLKELVLQSEPSTWYDLERDAAKSPEPAQPQREAKLEAALLRLCTKYLLFDEFNHIELLSSEEKVVQDFAELPFGHVEEVDDSQGDGNEATFDPSPTFGQFYAYASCFWLDHFNGASQESLGSLPDIAYLCRASSQTLKNWVYMYCRPDFKITSKQGSFVTDDLDPLIVLSSYGHMDAFNQLLNDYEKYSIYMASDSSRLSSIQLTECYGEPARLAALFCHPTVGCNLRKVPKLEEVLLHWSKSERGRAMTEDFFDSVMPTVIREFQANDLLCAAARHGWISIVERLFEEAARDPSFKEELMRTWEGSGKKKTGPELEQHQSVGEAAVYGQIAMVRYLLQQDGIEAHLRYRDVNGNNVLHRLAHRGRMPEMFELLIPHFKDGVDQVNDNNDTPLDILVFDDSRGSSNPKAAEVLLKLGRADVRAGFNGGTGNFHSTLRRAARGGHSEMCRVLVEVGGADPRSVLRDDGELIEEFTDTVVSPKEKNDTLCTLLSLAENYTNTE